MAVLDSPDSYIWKHAKDLTQNDYLMFSTDIIEGQKTCLPDYQNVDSSRVSDINIPNLDTDMAWFFGYFHGNGSVYNKNYKHEICISIPSMYPEIVQKIIEELEKFGIKSQEYKQGNCIRIKGKNKNLGLYFDQFKKSWSDIEVPEFILTGTVEIRCAYLAGLFDADGGFPKSKRLTVLLTSSSPSFLTQLQSVYASLGIPVRNRFIRTARQETHKDTYELHIVGKYSKEIWADMIGKYALKFDKTEYTKHTRYEEDYHYPRSWFQDVGKSQFGGYKIKSDYMSIDEYIERFDDKPKWIPIRVVEVGMTGNVVPTFDLSVESNHEYFCGEGLLNHNSAEIALGDVEDKTFINLKNYIENPERGEIGWMSNNSVVLSASKDYRDFTFIPDMAKRIVDNGEPGMINLYNVQKYGRYGKEIKDTANLTNPCG